METRPGRPRRSRPIAAIILLGVGALIATGWMAITLPTLAFVVRARATEAVYVDSVAHVGGNHGGTFLYPRFSFRTLEGRTVTFTASSGSTEQPFGDGQKVRVLYDPERPTQAHLDSIFDLWAGPLFLSPFAATPIGIAVLIIRARRRPGLATSRSFPTDR